MIGSRTLRRTVGLLTVVLAPTVAAAQNLLISTGLGSYDENMYGGARWSAMTGFINTTFPGAVTTTTTLSSNAFVLGFDRLWVDQRLGPTLSAGELSAISAFAATGRRMVLIGENDAWSSWNNQLASIVGGTIAGPDCSNGTFNTAIAHPLTAGVTSVSEVCGQSMSGGTSLFQGRGVATLWGANQNVLVWLDSNMQEDQYLSRANNRQFATNVATWLKGGTTVVPEPSTWAMMAAGLATLVVVGRRRRVV